MLQELSRVFASLDFAAMTMLRDGPICSPRGHALGWGHHRLERVVGAFLERDARACGLGAIQRT
jgi:hypothetical protein